MAYGLGVVVIGLYDVLPKKAYLEPDFFSGSLGSGPGMWRLVVSSRSGVVLVSSICTWSPKVCKLMAF